MAVPSMSSDDSAIPSNCDRTASRDPWVIEEMPSQLIDSPLSFIFAEHHRQREAASVLTMLADGEFDLGGVRALLLYLESDFALHIGDEELALFPMLREHCLPEDNVERILDRLESEHREDESSVETVTEILRESLSENKLKEGGKRRLRQFAEHIRQHLALENGVLLPIARVRLREQELKMLSDMFKQRRL